MTIIAAIDLSDLSRGVATLAAGIARAFGDELLIVHAVDARFTSNTDGVPSGQDELALLADAAQQSLRELRGSLGTAGLAVETRVLVGPPDAAIESLVREAGARMIIAGTHGRGVVGRMLSGSVVERLVLRVPCPILVIRHGHAPTSLERWLERPGQQPLGAQGQAPPDPAPLRVVVGLDRGDQATDAALAFAQELSTRGPCELTLVHEYWAPGEYVRLGMRGPRDLFETDPEVAAVLERDLRARISRRFGGMLSAPNVRFRVCAEWGPIGDALAREAHEAKADLIIVGSSQPHGWRRLKRASVALSTLHFAAIPLLCVPEPPPATTHDAADGGASAPVAIAAPLRSVLAATDLSEAGAAAVSHALSLLRAEGGVAHICTVSERALPSPMYVYAAEEGALSPAQIAALEERLRRLVPAEAKGLGIECRPCVIDGGDAAEQLVAAAVRLGVDAIVVASHGRSGVKRAVLGSVAEGVLRRAEVPVYVVHRGPAERD